MSEFKAGDRFERMLPGGAYAKGEVITLAICNDHGALPVWAVTNGRSVAEPTLRNPGLWRRLGPAPAKSEQGPAVKPGQVWKTYTVPSSFYTVESFKEELGVVRRWNATRHRDGASCTVLEENGTLTGMMLVSDTPERAAHTHTHTCAHCGAAGEFPERQRKVDLGGTWSYDLVRRVCDLCYLEREKGIVKRMEADGQRKGVADPIRPGATYPERRFGFAAPEIQLRGRR